MSIKLSHTQLMILSAAALRDDRCLVAPKTLKGGVARKVAAVLLAGGLAREIKTKADMAIWRVDDETAQAYSLKLTAAGMKAIAVDEDDARPHGGTDETPGAKASGATVEIPASVEATASRGRGPAKDAEVVAAAAMANATITPASATVAPAPRDGTKIARVIELLRRDQGATLEALIADTGWLPHTTRAALTRLRQAGHDIRLDRREKGTASIYRIVATPAVAA